MISAPNGFTTSIRDQAQIESIHLSPNPVFSGDQISIDIPGLAKIERIGMYSMTGSEVPLNLLDTSGDTLTFKINDDLLPGAYLIQIRDQNILFVGKVMIIGQ